MTKRRQPKQTRSLATVDVILDAVSRVLQDGGRQALTTNRIAETAGVSIGTLYQYFSNKQDIYSALHERQFQRMTTSVTQAFLDTENGTLNDLLIQLMDAVISERLKDTDMHRMLMTTIPRRLETMKNTHPLSLAFYDAVAAHRHELQPDCDLDRFVFILSHLIESLANAVVLSRPATVSLDDARADAIGAIRSFVSAQTL